MAAIVLMITNNADPQCLRSGKPLRETVPFIEQVIPPQMAKPELWNINRLAYMPSPRLYSTHLPADGLPQSIWQKAKVQFNVGGWQPKRMIAQVAHLVTVADRNYAPLIITILCVRFAGLSLIFLCITEFCQPPHNFSKAIYLCRR